MNFFISQIYCFLNVHRDIHINRSIKQMRVFVAVATSEYNVASLQATNILHRRME